MSKKMWGVGRCAPSIKKSCLSVCVFVCGGAGDLVGKLSCCDIFMNSRDPLYYPAVFPYLQQWTSYVKRGIWILNFQIFCICRDKKRVGPAESSRFFDTILEVLVVNVKASPPELDKRSNQQQRIAPLRQGVERNEEFRRTTWHHAASKFHQSLLDRARKREREKLRT